ALFSAAGAGAGTERLAGAVTPAPCNNWSNAASSALERTTGLDGAGAGGGDAGPDGADDAGAGAAAGAGVGAAGATPIPRCLLIFCASERILRIAPSGSVPRALSAPSTLTCGV